MNYGELLSTCFIFKAATPVIRNYLILYIPIPTALTLHEAQIEIFPISPKWFGGKKDWNMTVHLDLFATYDLYFKHLPVWYIFDRT
jgi:hypothetical protein